MSLKCPTCAYSKVSALLGRCPNENILQHVTDTLLKVHKVIENIFYITGSCHAMLDFCIILALKHEILWMMTS